MSKRLTKSNVQLVGLIQLLKRLSIEQKVNVWKRIAEELERPTRQMRVVNIYKIEKCTNDDEIAIVPGKVLGTGDLKKKISVAAWNFSESAKEKITKAKGSYMSIPELMQKNPKGQNLRIIG